MTISVSELVERVRDRLDEPTAAQWTDAMLRRWINEGNWDLARLTRHYKDRTTISTTAGEAEYAVPENVLAVEHAYWEDVSATRQVPLAGAHWEAMDQYWGEHQDWEGAWPQMYTVWGYSPNLVIRLYPVPGTTGETVTLHTAILPDEIPDTGDDEIAVDVPTAWYDALAEYATYMALRRDRDPEWQTARAQYDKTADMLLHANDYLAVNRELIPDLRAGYVPWWVAGEGGPWDEGWGY